ncbi:MAG: Do family serine endopeptidase [Gammaproteobacteria bacterium]|nr:Do family serine endopeptidase [Gammaproteobacteria bacterium]
MQTRKILIFLAEATVIGLAVAFVVTFFFRPETLEKRPVVELKESAPAATGAVAPASGPASYSNAVEFAAPAVVSIYTTKTVTQRANPLLEDPFFRRFFGDNLPPPGKRQENSLGSGVIISNDGYVLTNNHVIAEADEIKVATRDGRDTTARLVGSDPESDLAVLKIDLPDLPSITIGQSDALRVGDVVLAIGNPFGVGQTVTMGIVSATQRSELGINVFENFIQTDAAINPGNSGGALINASGQLIGINTAIFSRSGGSEGIGFAIPVSLAKEVMQQIIEKGRPVRGWLGIEAQDLTPELAESFGVKATQGVVVAGILPNSPADKGGLKAGDIITRVNDQAVASAREIVNTISRIAPGTEARLSGLRNGKEVTLTIRVGERPKPREDQRQ